MCCRIRALFVTLVFPRPVPTRSTGTSGVAPPFRSGHSRAPAHRRTPAGQNAPADPASAGKFWVRARTHPSPTPVQTLRRTSIDDLEDMRCTTGPKPDLRLVRTMQFFARGSPTVITRSTACHRLPRLSPCRCAQPSCVMLRPSLASYGISKAAFGALTHKSLRSAARCRVKAVDSGRTEAGALVRRQVVHDHAVRAATRRAGGADRARHGGGRPCGRCDRGGCRLRRVVRPPRSCSR